MTTKFIESQRLVEHLFRHHWGVAVSGLTRQFGVQKLDEIEDAVQESYLVALRVWPTRGVPLDPEAWLYTVARNRLLDRVRSARSFQEINAIENMDKAPAGIRDDAVPRFRDEIADDILRMMVLCCDPRLPRDSRSALTLRLVCGFSIKEIAAAYLCGEDTISKRLSRARAQLAELNAHDQEPTSDLIDERLDSILEAIYLLFNEGYSAHLGDQLVRFELCAEALRLMRLLLASNMGARAEVPALAALICLQSARLPSRLGVNDELMLLEDQDRSLWDRSLIGEGMGYLQAAAVGENLSRYHLEAGIAACHASAKNYIETNWDQILYYYDQLTELFPNEVYSLNRSVACAMVKGPEIALTELQGGESLIRIEGLYMYQATLAYLFSRQGKWNSAVNHYKLALDAATNQKEREFLQRQLSDCETHQLAVPRG